jgi:hypothetical protein
MEENDLACFDNAQHRWLGQFTLLALSGAEGSEVEGLTTGRNCAQADEAATVGAKAV